MLDAVQDAGNVGAILRTAAAAGIGDVVLGPGCAGAWTPRVLRAAQGAPYLVAGKTGTAQVIGMKSGEKYDEKRVREQHRDHALFIAYAPADDPKIALALLVENGGHGGSTAAPIAREVFDFHLLGKRPERKQPLNAEEAEGD